MNEHAVDIVTKSSATASWLGGIFGLFQGLSQNELAMWAGIVIAFLGMVINSSVNWYYKRKDHRLALRIAGLKDEE